jgi:ADP-heptose:LPS heptosyltransferase
MRVTVHPKCRVGLYLSMRFNRILLIRFDHVGDCILTVPELASNIKRSYPGCHISLLTTSRSAELMSWCPSIDHMMVFDPPWSISNKDIHLEIRRSYLVRLLSFWIKAIRGDFGHHDILIHLSMSGPEKIICQSLSNCRLGFTGPYTGIIHAISDRFLTERLKFDVSVHMVDNCHRLVAQVLPLEKTLVSPLLVTSRETLNHGEAIIALHGKSSSNLIGIHAGGWGSTKNWALERFAKLASTLHSRTGMHCLILGGPEQESSMDYVVQTAASSGVSKLMTPRLAEFAAVAAKLTMFIGNDGGPSHIVSALGVPCLVIFGPTDEGVYAPRGLHVRTIRSRVQEQRLDYPWASGPRINPPPSLDALSVEEVLAQALAIHDATRPSSLQPDLL